MSKAMLTVGIIILGLASLLLINIVSNYSTGSELDYYLVKETAEAAINDAIDKKSWNDNSQIRLDSEKFVENFLIRFANSVDNAREYTVTFYDINEVPPKITVKVDSKTVLAKDGEQVDFSTTYSGIVEAVSKADDSEVKAITQGIRNGQLGVPYESNGNTYKDKID